MTIEIIVIVKGEKGNIIPSIVEKIVIKTLIVSEAVVENLEVTK